MKKSSIKRGIIGGIVFFLAYFIKGLLDEISAPTIMYVLALVPIIVGIVYDYKHIRKMLQ